MGAGNVCVFGKCEGLYFVDNDFLDVYSKKIDGEDAWDFRSLRDVDEEGFEYDESESYLRREDFEWDFTEAIKRRFPSFEYVNKWISRTRRALLENELFYVVCEDNRWSLAIELIMKEGEYGGEEKVGLQMGLYRKYLKGIKEVLLDMNGEVGVYTGAWTSGVIKKESENGKEL